MSDLEKGDSSDQRNSEKTGGTISVLLLGIRGIKGLNREKEEGEN